jgi:hypothetical protein
MRGFGSIIVMALCEVRASKISTFDAYAGTARCCNQRFRWTVFAGWKFASVRYCDTERY